MPIKIIHNLWKLKWWIIITIFTTIIVGEIWMRLPMIPQRLEYIPDHDLDGRLAPNQKGFMWLGEMSLRSPLITLNSIGFRGEETNWDAPVILCLGGSDTFGSSVSDRDVWTAVLQKKMRVSTGISNLQVLNAAHPGQGPGHHEIRLNRILAKHRPDMVIVRVTKGMWNFQTPPQEEKDIRYEKAIFRQKVRSCTKFLPFLVSKLQMQIPGLKKAFRLSFFTQIKKKSQPDKVILEKRMWQRNHLIWERMISTLKEKDIPLVFCLMDVNATEGRLLLIKNFKDLISKKEHGGLLYLGPEFLGLDKISDTYRYSVFREKFTLRLDLHGNSLQHQLIAQKTFEFITSNLKKNLIK